MSTDALRAFGIARARQLLRVVANLTLYSWGSRREEAPSDEKLRNASVFRSPNYRRQYALALRMSRVEQKVEQNGTLVCLRPKDRV